MARLHKLRRAAVVSVALGAVLVVAAPATGTPTGAPTAGSTPTSNPYPYAPGWDSLHAGPENRKYVDTYTASAYTHRWSVLEGDALFAAPTVGPTGLVYQTAALGPGHSDLYAFTRHGKMVWQAPTWTDANTGLNGCAGLQSPIIDTSGDLYVSDCNKLWAFHADGTVKWVVSLPAAPAGSAFQDSSQDVPVNPLLTAAFTKDGSIIGTTLFGQVVVVSRHSGALEAPVLQLPGPAGPAVAAPPALLFSGGYMDPDLLDPLWQVAFAGNVVSANTPAVDEDNGLVMVVATDANPALGDLYAIRFTPSENGHKGGIGSLSIKFAAPVGAGSGSSPAISPDDSQTYVTDNNGVLYAVNNVTGAIAWTAQTDSLAQSVTVGGNGNIYIAGSSDMFAFNQSGHQLWHVTFSAEASALLPTIPGLGGPNGQPSGPMTATKDTLIEPIGFGYTDTLGGRAIPITVETHLVAISLRTGQVLADLGAEDDTAGANTALVTDPGLILAPHAPFETASQALYPLVNPTLAPYGLSAQEPVGGLEGLAATGGRLKP